MQIQVDEQRGIREDQTERQERRAQERVANPSRIPQTASDSLVGDDLIGLDRCLEDGLGQD
jgi:hypothetical protein